ncbi:MAG TPA: glycosyltransferase family 2 protein [Tepidiformaceae bacterium]|nr:glycosyltransferase family 2 protein [Tepidiformaceae bacterium]
MSLPNVAILTVTTNAAAHLPAYLDALCANTYPNWSLWVVDNASTDGSAEMVRRRIPGATVIENERNLGFTGACNRALEILMARPEVDFVLFLNDDTEVEPGFLEPLVARATGGRLVAPKTYLAGKPGILDDAVGDFDWWRGTWKRRVLGHRESARESQAHTVTNANLSALLVPVRAFEDAGLLDDAFFVYYDDTDFCRRALDMGYEIWFEPGSIVYHEKGATLGGQVSAFGCYYLSRNRPYLMRKHLGLPRFGVFMAYYLATRSVRMALWLREGRRDLVRATTAGIRDFACGRMGPRR